MRDDSNDALARLLEGYRIRLSRWVMAMVGRQVIVEEIVQETYLTVFLHYRNRDIASPWALLVDIAQNKAIDYLRRCVHEIGMPAADVEEIPEESRPDRLAEHEETSRRLKQAIGNLNPTLRQVVVMRYFDHLSRQEIAEQLSISLGAVEQRITRALGICRQDLQFLRPTVPDQVESGAEPC